MVDIKIGTWNERDNPDLPDRQVRSDARRVKARFRGASIIGCQEIGEAQDHRALHEVFGVRWRQVAKGQATPLLFNAIRFQLLARAYVQTHGGIAHVSPHRGYVKGLFSVPLPNSIAPWWVYNTHLISKPGSSAERLRLWRKHIRMMREDIADQHRDGRDIFVTGDFNVTRAPLLHNDQRVLAHHWLDSIIYIPGTVGNRVKVLDTFHVLGDLFTDHRPIGVTLRIEPRST